MWWSLLGLTCPFHPCWSFREKKAKRKGNDTIFVYRNNVCEAVTLLCFVWTFVVAVMLRILLMTGGLLLNPLSLSFWISESVSGQHVTSFLLQALLIKWGVKCKRWKIKVISADLILQIKIKVWKTIQMFKFKVTNVSHTRMLWKIELILPSPLTTKPYFNFTQYFLKLKPQYMLLFTVQVTWRNPFAWLWQTDSPNSQLEPESKQVKIILKYRKKETTVATSLFPHWGQKWKGAVSPWWQEEGRFFRDMQSKCSVFLSEISCCNIWQDKDISDLLQFLSLFS